MLNKLLSLFDKKSKFNMIDEAKEYDFFAPSFHLAIVGGSNGELNAIKWISKEPQFAACYMVGFACVLADSRPDIKPTIHPINIALYIFKRLVSIDNNDLGEAAISKVSNSFYEYLVISTIDDDREAFKIGYNDAINCINQKNSLPLGLCQHFEGTL